MREIPADSRPRERLDHLGESALSTAELLAIPGSPSNVVNGFSARCNPTKRFWHIPLVVVGRWPFDDSKMIGEVGLLIPK